MKIAVTVRFEKEDDLIACLDDINLINTYNNRLFQLTDNHLKFIENLAEFDRIIASEEILNEIIKVLYKASYISLIIEGDTLISTDLEDEPIVICKVKEVKPA